MTTPEVPNEPAARWVPIDSLRAWEKNPRHNEPAIARVAESIQRFGFGAPIVARKADSTIIDIEAALSGRTADLLFTDPPYGVSYQSHMAEGGTAARFRKIENDNLSPEELQHFLTDCFSGAAALMRPGAAFYICHANQR